MCGIVGFIGQVPEGFWDQTHRIMSALFVAAQHRGEHATGLAAALSPYKRPDAGQMVFAKQPLPANLFLRVDPLWRQLQHRRCAAIVGHVRWATHGSPLEPANNHPFVSKGFPWIIEVILHHILKHTAHHIDPRIPLYNLPAAQAAVEAQYGEVLHEPFTLSGFLRTLRCCKLYDYKHHQWVSFAGNPTSASHQLSPLS